MTYKAVGRSIINYAAPAWCTNLRDTNYRNIQETPKSRLKETLFTRHRNTVELIMLADNRKAALQVIHTDAVNKAVKDQKNNIVLDDLPHPINDSEKDLTRKQRGKTPHLFACLWSKPMDSIREFNYLDVGNPD